MFTLLKLTSYNSAILWKHCSRWSCFWNASLEIFRTDLSRPLTAFVADRSMRLLLLIILILILFFIFNPIRQGFLIKLIFKKLSSGMHDFEASLHFGGSGLIK